jgi:hypothetical protein
MLTYQSGHQANEMCCQPNENACITIFVNNYFYCYFFKLLWRITWKYMVYSSVKMLIFILQQRLQLSEIKKFGGRKTNHCF